MDNTFQEFRAYWQLSEEMIAKATKDELVETARILAIEAAHFARKYGDAALPDLSQLLSLTQLEGSDVGYSGTEPKRSLVCWRW